MVDTLHLGARVYRTLCLRRAHPLPKIVLLYTPSVRSATQSDALKSAKPFTLPWTIDVGSGSKAPFWTTADDFRSSLTSRPFQPCLCSPLPSPARPVLRENWS